VNAPESVDEEFMLSKLVLHPNDEYEVFNDA
jgi:hypothetical protein